MSIEKQHLFFLSLLLIGVYVTVIPTFLDMYTMGRFAVWTILCLGGLWLIVPQTKKVDIHLLDYTLFGFYLLNIVSISWSKNFGEAIFTSQKYLLLFVLYYVLRHLFTQGKRDEKQTANLLLVLSILVIGITSVQMIQTLLNEGLRGKSIYKVIALSGHKNLVSSYLFMLFGLNLFYFVRYPRPIWIYFILGAQLLLILLLRSRAVYIAVAIFGLGSMLYFLFSNSTYRQLTLKRLLPLSAVLLILGGMLIQFTGAGKDYARYLSPSTYMTSDTGTERLFVWCKTWDLVKEKPLLGYGTGNWKLLFPSKNISGGYRLQQQDLVFTRVHNDFLEVLAEVGLIGLFLFLLSFTLAIGGAAQLMRSTQRQSKSSTEVLQHRQEGLILIMTIIGYAIISFFDFPKERPEHQILLALILALGANGGKNWFKGLPGYQQLSKRHFQLAAGGLTLFLLINLPINYYRIQSNIHSKQVLIGLATQNAPSMIEHAQKSHSNWCNVNQMVIPFKWYEGLAYYFQEQYDKAKPLFAESYEINPYNFNVANNYASTLVNLGEFEAAIPLYLQALEINPKFEEGMFNIAYSYFQIKQYDQALEWVNKVEINQEKKQVFLNKIEKERSQ